MDATVNEEYIILDLVSVLVSSIFLRILEFTLDMIGVKASASIGVSTITKGNIVATQNSVNPRITDSLASIDHKIQLGITVE